MTSLTNDFTTAFRLIGHANPFGEYPASVVPIGKLNGEYFAVYLREEGDAQLKKLQQHQIQADKDAFVKYGEREKDLIENFKFDRERLYALSPHIIQSYPASRQKWFFKKILNVHNIFEEAPFAALDLAETIGDSRLIKIAEQKCYEAFMEEDPATANAWWEERSQNDHEERYQKNGHERFYGTGRRKEAIARVYISEGSGEITINRQDVNTYFTRALDRHQVYQPLDLLGMHSRFDIEVMVKGGGESGQSSAIRLGLSRALADYNTSFRSQLRQANFLTRDPREVERKKVGLRKARKAPQYSKR